MRQVEHFSGLGTMYFEVSPGAPHGTHYVVCYKHPKNAMTVPIDFYMENGFKRGDAILQAFKNCPDCMQAAAIEDEIRNSRWPEGAEL